MSFGDDTLDPQNTAVAEREPSDNWFRPLKDDRLEVCLAGQTPDGVAIRMRASGAQEPIWQVVAMFEEMTGKEVVGDWKRPPRTGSRPIEGQLSITEQLESSDGED